MTQVVHDCEVRVERLEIALAHDAGVFRGRVEPVLLLAVYAVGAAATLMDRRHVAFPRPGRLPNTVVSEDASPLHVAWQSGSQPPFVLLAVAFEEDEGSDIQRVYGTLERADALSLWPSDDQAIEPLSLKQLADAHPQGTQGTRMHLLCKGNDEAEACEDDELVGVTAAVIPASGYRGQLRLHFLSADGRNDWTALVAVTREPRMA